MAAVKIRQKITVRIPRRPIAEKVEPPKPEPIPPPSLTCEICGKTACAENNSKLELLLTKSQTARLAWVGHLCCGGHKTPSTSAAVAGKVLCSVCGRLLAKGKKKPLPATARKVEGVMGAVTLSLYVCSDACKAAVETTSCAPKACWLCSTRAYGLGEAIHEAETGKITKPEQALSSLRTIRVCAACHLAAYCSPQCQKMDWPGHKAQCALMGETVPLVKHLLKFGPRVCPQIFALLA